MDDNFLVVNGRQFFIMHMYYKKLKSQLFA